MSNDGRKSYPIQNLGQIEALVAPTRQEIIDALESIGPAPVAAVAAVLGRSPDSLYYHIRVLLEVGLVRRVDVRARGRSREAIYDLAGHDMTIVYDLARRAKREALKALIRAMSRIASRDFDRAAESRRAVVDGPRRNLRGARMVGLLDRQQLEELNALYEHMAEILARPPRRPAEARFHAVTLLVAPLERVLPDGAAASR
jgi:DNA-binding transcriptional ArsR family regulator